MKNSDQYFAQQIMNLLPIPWIVHLILCPKLGSNKQSFVLFKATAYALRSCTASWLRIAICLIIKLNSHTFTGIGLGSFTCAMHVCTQNTCTTVY